VTTPDDVQAIRQHKLWPAAEGLRNNVQRAKGRTATDRHTLARVEAALTYLLGYKSLDAHLYPSGPYSSNVFQNLQGVVAQIASQVEGWDRGAAMSSSTVNQLDQQADRLLDALANAPWPSLQKESRAQVVIEAAGAFQRATESSVEMLLHEIERGQDEMRVVRSSLGDLETEAMERGEQAKVAIEAIEHARQKNVAEAKASVNEALKLEAMQAHELRATYEKQAQDHLDSLAKNAERGQELVNLVGDQAVGEGYARFADNEMMAHRWWNVVGVVAGVAVVVYLGWEFRQLNEVTLQTAIVRVALSVPGLGIAAYAFQQASRRHKQSVEARYRALDLLALGPFTNEMHVDQQTLLRVALGQRLFASNQSDVDTKSDSQKQDFSITQVQAVVDFLKSAQDLNKP
jgi:hypothetical protein